MRLFLLLVVVPIIEIALFIEVGGLIGTWPTIAIVVLTALAGSILLRRQGLAALGGFRQRLAAGEAPERLLADGAMILVSGALLLTPGFFTDAVGLALLLPPVRAAFWRYLSARIKAGEVRTARWRYRRGPARPASGQTVDGSYTVVTPEESEEPDKPGAGRLETPRKGA